MSLESIRTALDEAETFSPANGDGYGRPTHAEINDMGNAQRFANTHQDRLAFCPAREQWFGWVNTHWEHQTKTRIIRYAEQVVRQMDEAARATAEGAAKDEFMRHVKRSGSRTSLQAMADLARGHLEVPLNSWDANEHVLNIANGTIDLRTGMLEPNNANDHITSMVNIAYDEHATCSIWDQFIRDITCNDQELAAYLQRVVGYTLTGSIQEQKIFILHGPGANGKSTFLEIVRKLLGSVYARQTPSSTFCAKNPDTIRSDLARLVNARFVTSAELEIGHQLSESLIKQITGGEPITARNLYRDFFEYTPRFKLFIAVNHLPHIRNTDNGIWRRIQRILFKATFNDQRRDPDLQRKLEGELAGILRWAVQGAMEWYRNGLGTPPTVIEASSEYRAQVDTVERFISECCEVSPEYKEPCKRLQDAYKEFCSENNLHSVSVSKLWAALAERDYGTSRTKKDRFRDGLRLKEDDAGDTGDSTSNCYPIDSISKKQCKEVSPRSPQSLRKRLKRRKPKLRGDS